MTKYVYYITKSNDGFNALKYKIVYENQNYITLLAKSGCEPVTIKRKTLRLLSTDEGKQVLGDILIDKGFYWGVYFDANPLTVNKEEILEASRIKAREKLEYAIKSKESTIKYYNDNIEKLKAKIIEDEMSLHSAIKIEVTDDTENL